MVSDIFTLLSRGQLASAASTKTSSSCWSIRCPSGSFERHGIRRKPKHEPELPRVAPGCIIDERIRIEELVVPASMGATATETWRLSDSELPGTHQHQDRPRQQGGPHS